jgi:hypothetical protein
MGDNMRPRAKRTSQRYAVDMFMQARDIAKAGAAITLEVRDRGVLIGTMEVGQGTFGWKSGRRRRFHRLSWTAFADRFERMISRDQ